MDQKNLIIDNGIMLQGFEWNCPADQKHYLRLKSELPKLREIGITALWLPPGCKAMSPEGNGYDIYDLYDLGEFDQKGSKATKWGSKQDLLDLTRSAREHKIQLIWDAVLNHKAGADKKERVLAVEVDEKHREKEITEPQEILGWLGFEFLSREGRYSKQKYHWYHFNGTDYDAQRDRKAIFKFKEAHKGWSDNVGDENGNADFLMFANLDYSHPEVVADVNNWGRWIVKEVGLSGFRLDAVQHFSQLFTQQWIEQLNHECGEELFYVGEFWDGDVAPLQAWLKDMRSDFYLFDAPLLHNFSKMSHEEHGDLRSVFEKTLVQLEPARAVTCVQNHDTQLGQTVETPVKDFFKPLAYSIILLRKNGYPCVFYGDLYGTQGEQAEEPSCGGKLADIILARKLYAYGDQVDCFKSSNCIGWVRKGTSAIQDGLVCVMSNAKEGELEVNVGRVHTGEIWTDVLGWQRDEVRIDEEGNGVFKCQSLSVSIWVNKKADGRGRFPVNFDSKLGIERTF